MIFRLINISIIGLSLLSTTPALAFDHQHAPWTQLLQQYVTVKKNGSVSTVNYRSLKNNSTALNQYLQQLSAITPSQYQSWNKEQQLAFLINAYNAFTVKLIVDHYPVNSIKDIGNLLQSPWQKKFILLLGKTISLNEIEHQMIRGRNGFHEPRIHFAVNCASIGCPALRNEAYIADRIEQQLQQATLLFLSDQERNYMEENTLYLSSIFKWYGEDFGGDSSLQKWLAPYATQIGWRSGRDSTPESIRFLDYDWRLNE